MTDTLTSCVWLAVGLLAGLTHATMLWRAAHRLSAWTPLLGMLRLAVVAAALLAAALWGSILAAAAGWASGFAALGASFVWQRPMGAITSPKVHSGE